MQFPFQIESVCVIGLPSAHLSFANFQGLIGRWKVAFYDALIKFFASLQIFLFMPVKQMSWPILVRCQIKQELIRSKKSNVLKKGHFVEFIYTFRIGGTQFPFYKQQQRGLHIVTPWNAFFGVSFVRSLQRQTTSSCWNNHEACHDFDALMLIWCLGVNFYTPG